MKLSLLLVLVAATAGAAAAATAGSTQPKKAMKPAIQARARTIALHAADLPGSGWDTASPAIDLDRLPRCPFYEPDESDLTENGSFSSPNFHRADGSAVASSVAIFSSAEQGRVAYDRVARLALARCLGRLLARSDLTIGSVRKLWLHVSARSTAFRISFRVPSAPKGVRVSEDIVLVNRRGVVVAILFTGLRNPFPGTFETHIVGRLLRQL